MAKKKHPRLRNQANEIAAAGSAPQENALHREIHSTRRDEHRATQSTRSMGAALQDTITLARKELKNTPGLTQADKATALATLSSQRLTAQAGANFATKQVHQDYAAQREDLRSQLADTAAEERATAQATLADLLAEARGHRQDVAAREDEQAFQRHQAKLDRKASSGLTPTQARAEHNATVTAKQVAHNMIQEHGIPSTKQDWAAFERLVASSEGTDPLHAKPIVKRLRHRTMVEMFGGGIGGGISPAARFGTVLSPPGGYTTPVHP